MTMRVIIAADGLHATLRNQRWRMVIPVTDLEKWLRFSRRMADHVRPRLKGHERAYEEDAAAIEAAMTRLAITIPKHEPKPQEKGRRT